MKAMNQLVFDNFDLVKALDKSRSSENGAPYKQNVCVRDCVKKTKRRRSGIVKGIQTPSLHNPNRRHFRRFKVQLDGSQSYFEYINNNNNNSNNNLPASATATRPIKAEDRVSFLWEQIEGPKVTL